MYWLNIFIAQKCWVNIGLISSVVLIAYWGHGFIRVNPYWQRRRAVCCTTHILLHRILLHDAHYCMEYYPRHTIAWHEYYCTTHILLHITWHTIACIHTIAWHTQYCTWQHGTVGAALLYFVKLNPLLPNCTLAKLHNCTIAQCTMWSKCPATTQVHPLICGTRLCQAENSSSAEDCSQRNLFLEFKKLYQTSFSMHTDGLTSLGTLGRWTLALTSSALGREIHDVWKLKCSKLL